MEDVKSFMTKEVWSVSLCTRDEGERTTQR